MSKLFLNNMAQQYARVMNPAIRGKGVAIALGAGAFACGLGMGAMAIEANGYAEDTGKSFADAWQIIRAEFGNNWRNGTIGLMIGAYLLVEIAIGASKAEAKRYAEFVVKRYLRDAHIDVSDADSRMYRNIANLILANMTETERAEVLKTGILLSKALDKNGDLSQTVSQERVQRKALLITSKNRISERIDSVFERNSGLSTLIMDILNGRTYFNPRAFGRQK